MQYIPITTRIMKPPKDDLFAVLDEFLTDVQEKDVILITSKVVAINQGRCVSVEGFDKTQLINDEADYVIGSVREAYPLTLKYHAMLPSSGIDESNSNGYYTLLPEDPFEEAQEIWEYVRSRHGITDVGIIITDSHLTPLRAGVLGISISFWGIEPVERHAGKKDLFGRTLEVTATNIVDALASGAGLVSGETSECSPIVIARGAPGLTFTVEDRRDSFLIPPEEDVYHTLFKRFIK